jgi:hypothetical protein
VLAWRTDALDVIDQDQTGVEGVGRVCDVRQVRGDRYSLPWLTGEGGLAGKDGVGMQRAVGTPGRPG